MSIEYVEKNDVYYCTKCKHHYYVLLNEPRPKNCDFCDNIDPWLYQNAIVELIHNNGDRETVRYTGQVIRTKYCVRGTPWENVHPKVKVIEIDSEGNCFYEIREDSMHMDSFYWATCPESLKSDNPHKIKRYERPDWTKYLPGVK